MPGPVAEGSCVVLGFDGSQNRDATALVVVSVGERPHVDVVDLWERPPTAADWHVPVGEVLATIRAACESWEVVEIAADTSRWVHELESLDEEGFPVVAFPQSRGRMIPATQRAYEAICNGTMTHSGDPRLARHVANAIRKPDGQLAKVSKHSPRKIDLAVAMVMALERAAVLEPEPKGIVITSGDEWLREKGGMPYLVQIARERDARDAETLRRFQEQGHL
jgi:phage terminase large subunit-like protein